MHFEVAKMWVTALREGTYRQGLFNLHHKVNDTYCCLGVLCDIYQRENPNNKLTLWQHEDCDITYFDDESETLPNRVKEWAGMQTRNGLNSRKNWSGKDYMKKDLATLNDTDRMSFEGIANYIEDNYMYL